MTWPVDQTWIGTDPYEICLFWAKPKDPFISWPSPRWPTLAQWSILFRVFMSLYLVLSSLNHLDLRTSGPNLYLFFFKPIVCDMLHAITLLWMSITLPLRYVLRYIKLVFHKALTMSRGSSSTICWGDLAAALSGGNGWKHVSLQRAYLF